MDKMPDFENAFEYVEWMEQFQRYDETCAEAVFKKFCEMELDGDDWLSLVEYLVFAVENGQCQSTALLEKSLEKAIDNADNPDTLLTIKDILKEDCKEFRFFTTLNNWTSKKLES
jgi:hypothetical protein